MTDEKKPSFLENFEQFQEATIYGALGAVTPARRRVGLRLATSFQLTVAAALPLAMGYIDHSTPLMAYAGVILATGHWQGYHRWQEMKRGEGIHTYSLGASPLYNIRLTQRVRKSPLFARFPFLNGLHVPQWLLKENRVHRHLDPFATIGVGLVAFCFNQPLGEYMIFSGVCLRIYEEYRYKQRNKNLFDAFDDGENAETLGQILTSLRKPRLAPDGSPAIPDEDDAPIRVGQPGDDIREQVDKRFAEQEARAKARRNPVAEAADSIKQAAEAGKAAAEAGKATAEAFKEAAEAGKATAEAVKEAVGAYWEATAARETVIIATERTTREVLIVQPEFATYRVVIPGPIPDGMSAQEWFLTYSVYPERFTFTPEQQAEILAAYDERQITGDTRPIMIQPPATPEPEEMSERERAITRYFRPEEDDQAT